MSLRARLFLLLSLLLSPHQSTRSLTPKRSRYCAAMSSVLEYVSQPSYATSRRESPYSLTARPKPSAPPRW